MTSSMDPRGEEKQQEEEDGIEDSNIDSYQRNETIDFMKIPL